MKPLSIILFCTLSLVASVALSYALYPHASRPEITQNNQAKNMEDFEEMINLGEDYGPMSVIDLMGFYLENPPSSSPTKTLTVPKVQFGGC